jgi:hypothetical protein
MKKKRHRVIDPRKARAAAGGGIVGWYERIPVPGREEIGEPEPSCKAEHSEEVPFPAE